MFWDILVDLCVSRGTTPTAVVSKLDISVGSITRWKSGSVPRSSALYKLSDYFGVSPDYLLGKEESPTPSADSVFSLSKEEQEIILTYRENEAFRDAVMNIYRLTKPAEQKTVRVFRAARSADNHGPEVVEMDADRLERLNNLPDTDDPL